MQLETPHRTCPLCKRPSASTPTGTLINSRLCTSCRATVASAFRGAPSTIASLPTTVSGGLVDATNIVDHIPQAIDEVDSVSQSFIEDTAIPETAFDLEAKQPLLFEEPHDRKFEFFEKDDSPVSSVSSSPTFPVSDNGSPKRHIEFPILVGRPTLVAERQPEPQFIQVEPPVLAEAPLELSSTTGDLAFAQPTIVNEPIHEPVEKVADYEASTDPWAAPLPPWDYSQSEWPVLVGVAKEKSTISFRAAIAAVFVLIVAGTLYFLINSSSVPDRPAPSDPAAAARASAAGDSRPAMAPISADRRKDASSPETKSTSSIPTDSIPHDASAANEKVTAHGQFSLQAAAFPTEHDAEIFAAKLKQARLPSYVVPADVAHRGRWYRVRVGRFDAAEDAQKFAGEAQQRARAAGLAVQLIVCQYDQP